jgi:hypothetical protein
VDSRVLLGAEAHSHVVWMLWNKIIQQKIFSQLLKWVSSLQCQFIGSLPSEYFTIKLIIASFP